MPMLKKMKMPKREEISVDELEMEPMGDELAGEGEGEGGMPEPMKAPADLESVSDEDLMAELKKRGLMGKLAEESPEEMSRDEMLGAEEQEDEMSEYV